MTAFPGIQKINYGGPDSDNPLAFRWYKPTETVAVKTMAEHLRFTVVYWHTVRGNGSDPLVPPRYSGRGLMAASRRANAGNRVRAAFEFFEKLQISYYSFHDRDVAPREKRWQKRTPISIRSRPRFSFLTSRAFRLG